MKKNYTLIIDTITEDRLSRVTDFLKEVLHLENIKITSHTVELSSEENVSETIHSLCKKYGIVIM